MPTDRPHPEAGFTLLEALVALAVLAIVGTAVLELAALGVRGVTRAGEEAQLARLAADLLETTDGLPAPPGEARSGTTNDGLSWQITSQRWIEPLARDPAKLDLTDLGRTRSAQQGPSLWRVTVTVSDSTGASYKLAVLRLGPPA
jgi:prepilin-type N-terminal cleavage/methylation domain-containing protein